MSISLHSFSCTNSQRKPSRRNRRSPSGCPKSASTTSTLILKWTDKLCKRKCLMQTWTQSRTWWISLTNSSHPPHLYHRLTHDLISRKSNLRSWIRTLWRCQYAIRCEILLTHGILRITVKNPISQFPTRASHTAVKLVHIVTILSKISAKSCRHAPLQVSNSSIKWADHSLVSTRRLCREAEGVRLTNQWKTY